MPSFDAKFLDAGRFNATFGNVTQVPGGDSTPLDKYDGPYNVVPKMVEQILETKDKSMTEDVTVNGIPYHEVSNKSGTTLIIAS